MLNMMIDPMDTVPSVEDLTLPPKRKFVDANKFMEVYMAEFKAKYDPQTGKTSATLEDVAEKLNMSLDTAYQKMRNIRIKLKEVKGIEIPILATRKKVARKRSSRLDLDSIASMVVAQHLAELD